MQILNKQRSAKTAKTKNIQQNSETNTNIRMLENDYDKQDYTKKIIKIL